MSKMVFFASDLHAFHRSILAFSPSRIKVLGLNYNASEIAEQDKIRRDKSASGDQKKLAKSFIEQVTKDYNEALVEQWNDTVALTDMVYNLGDVSFAQHREDTKKILARMNGIMHLVRGNHDHKIEDSGRFEWIKDYYEFKERGHHFVLFHFPISSWHQKERGSIALSGHMHGTPTGVTGKTLDVGMESIGKVAIEMDEVIQIMKTKPIESVRNDRLRDD